MPRAGVDTDKIIEAAAAIADEKGLEAVTLREVSRRFQVSSPSLYNHIGGLPELREKGARHAMEMLRERLIKATMGRGGIDALKEMGRAYIQFAREHPGLYESLQWMNIAADVAGGSLFSEVVQLVYKIAGETGAGELEASHIIRTVRSLAHGFASVESHQGFSHPSSVESSYEYALDMLFLGIERQRDRKSHGNES